MLYYALLTSLLMLIPQIRSDYPRFRSSTPAGRCHNWGYSPPAILLHVVTAVLLLEVGFQIARKITLDSGAIGGANLLTLALHIWLM